MGDYGQYRHEYVRPSDTLYYQAPSNSVPSGHHIVNRPQTYVSHYNVRDHVGFVPSSDSPRIPPSSPSYQSAPEAGQNHGVISELQRLRQTGQDEYQSITPAFPSTDQSCELIPRQRLNRPTGQSDLEHQSFITGSTPGRSPSDQKIEPWSNFRPVSPATLNRLWDHVIGNSNVTGEPQIGEHWAESERIQIAKGMQALSPSPSLTIRSYRPLTASYEADQSLRSPDSTSLNRNPRPSTSLLPTTFTSPSRSTGPSLTPVGHPREAYGQRTRSHTATTPSSHTLTGSLPLSIMAESPLPNANSASQFISSTLEENCAPLNDLAVSRIVRDPSSGRTQGAFSTLGKRKPNRKPLDKEAKVHAQFVRTHGGSCERCSRLKKKCLLADNPYECCNNCKDVKKRHKIPRMPCFQSRITEALFFRSRPLQDSPLDQKRRAVYDLSDFSTRERATRTLKLVQEDMEVEVYVAEFEATAQDRTAYEYKTSSGGKNRLEMPHYCLTDIPKVTSNLRSYAKQSRDTYLAELAGSHSIIALTLKAAIAHGNFRKVSSHLTGDQSHVNPVAGQYALPSA